MFTIMILRKIEKLMRWIKTRYKSLSFIQQRNNREKKIDLRTLPAQHLVIFNSKKSVPGRTNAITHNERL